MNATNNNVIHGSNNIDTGSSKWNIDAIFSTNGTRSGSKVQHVDRLSRVMSL